MLEFHGPETFDHGQGVDDEAGHTLASVLVHYYYTLELNVHSYKSGPLGVKSNSIGSFDMS
jgi:hypothetical protein